MMSEELSRFRVASLIRFAAVMLVVRRTNSNLTN